MHVRRRRRGARRPPGQERAVQEWLGQERYYVQLAHVDLDDELVVTFEVWDVRHHDDPFREIDSTTDDLPDVA
jgi:hypothetical protein